MPQLVYRLQRFIFLHMTPRTTSSPQTTLKHWVDGLLYFLFCFLLGTGLMLKFSYVKGRGAQTVLGLSKNQWCDWHLYAGILMLVLAAVHLWLNRNWIKSVACGRNAFKMWLALGAGIILAALLALWPTQIAS